MNISGMTCPYSCPCGHCGIEGGGYHIFELLALKKPNLLIPLSRQASRGDQILNAESFRRQGFSMVLADEELTPDTLADRARTLYENREDYRKAMAGYGQANGTHEVIKVLEEFMQQKARVKEKALRIKAVIFDLMEPGGLHRGYRIFIE